MTLTVVYWVLETKTCFNTLKKILETLSVAYFQADWALCKQGLLIS